MALLILSGFAAVIAMARAGIRSFWLPLERSVPRVRLTEITPVLGLLFLCTALTVQAEPAMRFLGDTAASLHAPQAYTGSVMPPGPPAEARPGP
jgi:multicomponent K+:H+ antiporter subunit D